MVRLSGRWTGENGRKDADIINLQSRAMLSLPIDATYGLSRGGDCVRRCQYGMESRDANSYDGGAEEGSSR